MRRKLFTLIASLILMVSTVSPGKVEAQSNFIAAQHVLSIVEPQSIGPDEGLEVYLTNSQVPMPPTQGSTPLIVGTLQPAGVLPGGPVCPSQTFQFTVGSDSCSH